MKDILWDSSVFIIIGALLAACGFTVATWEFWVLCPAISLVVVLRDQHLIDKAFASRRGGE